MKTTPIPKYTDNIAPTSYSGITEEKSKARQVLALAKRQEKLKSYTTVRVNRQTVILVADGKNLERAKKRYKEAMQ